VSIRDRELELVSFTFDKSSKLLEQYVTTRGYAILNTIQISRSSKDANSNI